MTETNATVWPPGRYGRRREPRTRPRWVRQAVLAAMVTGVILAGTVAGYVFSQQYGPGRPYDGTVVRFYDITDEQVVVEFRVTVPEGEAATCAVRARSGDGAEVGRAEVRVDPPGGETRPLVTHRLATSERPVTGEVQRCWRAGEPATPLED